MARRCNSGVANWVYRDPDGAGNQVEDPNAPAAFYYWRALNERNMPKPSMAQAIANYFRVPTLGASSGANVQIRQSNRWVPVPADGRITVAGKKRPVGEPDVLRLAPTWAHTASSGHSRHRPNMSMRTLLLGSLAFLAVACSLTPPSPASPNPVQGEAVAAPALAEPAPAETPPSPPAYSTAGAGSDPCPPLSHTAQPPAWTGTPLHAAIDARDLQQVRLLAVGPALHELDSFEGYPAPRSGEPER